MRYATALAAVLLAIAGGLPPGLRAEAADPFFGTWRLDPARSHFAQDDAPKRMTIVIEPAPDGIAYRSEAQLAGGRNRSTQFAASFDGVPALVVGTAGFEAPISLSRVGETTIDAVYGVGLKKVAWSRWSVSADSRELSVDTTYLGKQGDEMRNLAVFRRAGN